MSDHLLTAAARATIRAHDYVAVALTPLVAFCALVLDRTVLAAGVGVLVVAIPVWARVWYTRVGALAGPGGHAVVTAVRHRGDVLADLSLDTGTGSVRLRCWTTRVPLPGEAVTLFGDPSTGVFAAISDKQVLLSAAPAIGRVRSNLTRPGSDRLTGGDWPRVGGHNRT